MTRAALILALCLASVPALPAFAGGPLLEPRLTLPGGPHAAPQVALTLDACSGKADDRIFGALASNRIPATVFVTARWLKRNQAATALMLSHPDLFQIENHGGQHVPAVDKPVKVYGIPATGSPEAVREEVEAGRLAVLAATGRAPVWYRGATGRYNSAAIAEIQAMGQAVAGYSLIADVGATLPAPAVEKRLAAAKDGDVIIAHVNHPEKPAGEGLVQGLLALKAKGYVFVKLGQPPAAKPKLAHAS